MNTIYYLLISIISFNFLSLFGMEVPQLGKSDAEYSLKVQQELSNKKKHTDKAIEDYIQHSTSFSEGFLALLPNPLKRETMRFLFTSKDTVEDTPRLRRIFVQAIENKDLELITLCVELLKVSRFGVNYATFEDLLRTSLDLAEKRFPIIQLLMNLCTEERKVYLNSSINRALFKLVRNAADSQEDCNIATLFLNAGADVHFIGETDSGYNYSDFMSGSFNSFKQDYRTKTPLSEAQSTRKLVLYEHLKSFAEKDQTTSDFS
jgi:hypothetical protein